MIIDGLRLIVRGITPGSRGWPYRSIGCRCNSSPGRCNDHSPITVADALIPVPPREHLMVVTIQRVEHVATVVSYTEASETK